MPDPGLCVCAELLPLLAGQGPGAGSQAGLTRAVLAELPGQLLQFMESHGVTPAQTPAPPAHC